MHELLGISNTLYSPSERTLPSLIQDLGDSARNSSETTAILSLGLGGLLCVTHLLKKWYWTKRTWEQTLENKVLDFIVVQIAVANLHTL